jgi:hypothetical protein
MPEIDSRVAFFKTTIKDFLDFVESRAKKEKTLTTDIGCRREMENLEKEAAFQKKLFGIL